MTESAASCAARVDPAHAWAATRTNAPSSPAESAVEITQQSVATPQRTIVAGWPAARASALPHAENVGLSTVELAHERYGSASSNQPARPGSVTSAKVS